MHASLFKRASSGRGGEEREDGGAGRTSYVSRGTRE